MFPDEETVVLRTFSTEIDAEVARGHLESHGIAVLVLRDDAGGMKPAFLAHGIRLLVLERDFRDAEDVLQAMNS